MAKRASRASLDLAPTRPRGAVAASLLGEDDGSFVGSVDSFACLTASLGSNASVPSWLSRSAKERFESVMQPSAAGVAIDFREPRSPGSVPALWSACLDHHQRPGGLGGGAMAFSSSRDGRDGMRPATSDPVFRYAGRSVIDRRGGGEPPSGEGRASAAASVTSTRRPERHGAAAREDRAAPAADGADHPPYQPRGSCARRAPSRGGEQSESTPSWSGGGGTRGEDKMVGNQPSDRRSAVVLFGHGSRRVSAVKFASDEQKKQRRTVKHPLYRRPTAQPRPPPPAVPSYPAAIVTFSPRSFNRLGKSSSLKDTLKGCGLKLADFVRDS